MSTNLSNSLRLSKPISGINIRSIIDGSEILVAKVTNLDGNTNESISLRGIALYIGRLIANDPAFMLPISSINGLGDILNLTAADIEALKVRVGDNEVNIAQNAADINILMQGPMLRTDTWPI